MNKYTDIEIQTAKNLLKEGYKWIARNGSGKLFAYYEKPTKADTGWYSLWYPIENSGYICKESVSIFQNIRSDDKEPTSLDSIVHPQILNSTEKEYLSAVIAPFRGKVKYIAKFVGDDSDNNPSCYIFVKFTEIDATIHLPAFYERDMYIGMEKNKPYSVGELGL